MQTDYQYRVATKLDLSGLHQLGLDAYEQYKMILDQDNWHQVETYLNNETTYTDLLKMATCYICEHEQEIIGMVFLIPHGYPTNIFQSEWAYIRLLGVNPNFQGRGIGQKLMQLCIDLAKSWKENILALHTAEFHDSARHIYQRLGFIKLKELDNYYNKKYYLYTIQLNNETTKVNYYKAKEEDIQILVAYRIMFALELSGEQSNDNIDLLKMQMTDYFRKAIQEETCISYIATLDGIVAGIGSVAIRQQPGNFKNLSGKWAYVMNMYTVPSFRRKGICAGILNALIHEAEKLGIPAFELHATPHGALVYEKQGFEIYKEPTYRKYL